MSDSILSQRDTDLIKQYLLGGAALGGGTALVTSLINYLKHLNKSKTEKDDDTLYVYQDTDGEEKKASLGGGLAITGGLLSSIGAYALVKKIYASLRKQEAQEELDAAQNAFLSVQGYKQTDKPKNKSTEDNEGTEKKASEGKPMSVLETITSIPVALPLILALGSGVVAHKMLDKSFPATKKPVKAPRRIEIVNKPTAIEEEEDAEKEEIEKPAFVRESDGMEFLLRMLAMEKKATSDVCNLIAATATGQLPSFKQAVDTIGYIDSLNLVKGASARKVDPFAEHLAITYLAKSARFKDMTGIIAAGEFAERHPDFFKMACALPESDKEDLYNIMQIVGHSVRSELSEEFGVRPPAQPLTKYAFSDAVMESLIERASKPTTKGDSNESTATSGEEVGNEDPDSPSRKKTKFVISKKTGRVITDTIPADIIDKILSPPSQPKETNESSND